MYMLLNNNICSYSPPDSQNFQSEPPDPSLINDAVKHFESTNTRANSTTTRELSVDDIYKGLTTLQSQAQNAVKGMTQRLDFQQGEQGKVEMAMREVHQILKTHQNEQRNAMKFVQQLKAPHVSHTIFSCEKWDLTFKLILISVIIG